MRLRNLVVTATLIPVLMLAGCGTDDAAEAASSPGAQKASKEGAATEAADAPENRQATADPVVNAYYDYRVALDTMMRSGGKATKQLIPVMTPELYRSISQQAKYFRTKKLHNTGTTKVLWAKRTLVAQGVIVRACYDTKLARTVDADGKSVQPARSPTRWVDEMRVELRDGRWVVDGGRATPTRC
ncbi:hypothetical protein FB561_6956 [Kribbella amoyensis]|uniref:Mce-associated membrane protein n=1 Tax=Kribbella amoyensis TaxID=996641 RepID=A0A561B2I8_9ACTN|nr:hypothetical protein [Kribbella amoyensis]TWD73071.1 hypothetical protein FB561_6956 [Kribbella amoyensis]